MVLREICSREPAAESAGGHVKVTKELYRIDVHQCHGLLYDVSLRAVKKVAVTSDSVRLHFAPRTNEHNCCRQPSEAQPRCLLEQLRSL